MGKSKRLDPKVVQAVKDRCWILDWWGCEWIENGIRCCSNQDLELHHNPPRGMGGTTKVYGVDGLIVLCAKHHRGKGHCGKIKGREGGTD